MSEQAHNYAVNLAWKEGRVGNLSSPVLNNSIEVATPPEFEGGVEGIWSPEHLFVASVASCFMTTFTAIAGYSKLAFENLNVQTLGIMDKVEGKYAITEIILRPTLLIEEEKYTDKAHRILEKAEAACLITRSIKTKVKLEPEVKVGALS